ncbi:MAG: aminomethyl-transferring glycine dehydrogenase subunit GcvPA [Acidobacteriota bacterium]
MMSTNDARGGGKYFSQGPDDRRRMLDRIGVKSVDDLFASIPENLRFCEPLPVEDSLAELDLVRHLQDLAAQNGPAGGALSFLGAGCYPHYVPAHVDALIQRQEFMTSYTPYQPEISQGMLQSIFEFQSLICMLTAMDVCNASMYDGGSGVGEAVLMARRLRKRGGRVLWSEALHPAYREVAMTYATHLDLAFELLPVGSDGRTVLSEIDDDVVAVVLQQPNFFGIIEDLRRAGENLKEAPAKLVVATAEPLAWALAVPAGEVGADIVVGELQSFGNALNYGGPMVGFMACRQEAVRSLPGRLAGQTVDEDGHRGFVLTLATREQHIRREKATSNICTNTALCALATCIYLCSLGRSGLQELARTNVAKGSYARTQVVTDAKLPAVYSGPHFNEFVVRVPEDAEQVVRRCGERGVVPGVALGRFDPERRDQLLICATEVHRRADIDRLAATLAEVCS